MPSILFKHVIYDIMNTVHYALDNYSFYPPACAGIDFTHSVRMGGWIGRQWEKVVQLLYYIRNYKVLEVKLGRDIGWGSRCATSWCDLDLTFDLAAVILSLKIFPGYISENVRYKTW